MKAKVKESTVDCFFWDGVNREPVYEALESVLRAQQIRDTAYMREYYPEHPSAQITETGWREYVRFTADEESGEQYDDYNMVKLWWCGGPEVSPDNWLVWFWDPIDLDWSFEILTDQEFHALYDLEP